MLIITLGILITVLTSVLAFIEKYKIGNSDRNSKRNNKIASITFGISIIGACITLYAGFNAIQEKKESDRKVELRQVQIDSQNQAITGLQKINIRLSENNLRLSDKIDTTSSSILLKAGQIVDYNKGEGSLIYIDYDLARYSGWKRSHCPIVIHFVGNNPLHDFRITSIMEYSPIFDTLFSLEKYYFPVIYPSENEQSLYEDYRIALDDGSYSDYYFMQLWMKFNGKEYLQELRKSPRGEGWETEIELLEIVNKGANYKRRLKIIK